MSSPKVVGKIKKGEFYEEKVDIYRFSVRFTEHSGKIVGCYALIEKESPYLYGHFDITGNDFQIKSINLYTDFWDLLDLFERKAFSDFISNNIFFDISLTKTKEDFLDIPIFGNILNEYEELKDFLKKCDFNNISISNFVLLLSQYNATFKVSYLPYTSSGYKKVLYNDNIKTDNSKITIVYDCYSILDVLFSFLHYCKTKNYKLEKCPHCGRWFFKGGGREGNNKKYCNRKSTFNGYEHLECEQAVRNINQELQRKKKRIYNSIVAYYPCECAQPFLDRCDEYRSKIKSEASVQNLLEYCVFLTNYKKNMKDGENNG